MASGPITSWEIDAEKMESDRLYFWGSKITADGDCSHEIKRRLLLGRKVMTNLDSILKSKDIREQDGGRVGGHGIHLFQWIHQEHIFRHRSACRTPAESG